MARSIDVARALVIGGFNAAMGKSVLGVRVLVPVWLNVIAIFCSLSLGGSLGVNAQIATPNVETLPDAAAPFALATVAMPACGLEIEALLTAMPSAVAGEQRRPLEQHVDRVQVQYGAINSPYGHPLMLAAVSFEDGDFFPPTFTAGMYVAMASATSDYESTGFGRDGNLVWIRAEPTLGVGGDKPGTPALSRTLYTLAWGNADSPWLFTALADSPEGLGALVMAFVASASTGASTPVAASCGA